MIKTLFKAVFVIEIQSREHQLTYPTEIPEIDRKVQEYLAKNSLGGSILTADQLTYSLDTLYTVYCLFQGPITIERFATVLEIASPDEGGPDTWMEGDIGLGTFDLYGDESEFFEIVPYLSQLWQYLGPLPSSVETIPNRASSSGDSLALAEIERDPNLWAPIDMQAIRDWKQKDF